jgi:uncharacterized membrane protein YraQ (UPF0718 family)
VALAGGIAIRIHGDPPAVITTFSTRFLGIFIDASPFLLLGSVASGLIEVFISRSIVARFVPRNPALGAVAGTLLGFVFPVCECGVVPVTRRLYAKGLPVSVGVAFLLASPVMNPIVFASTWIAFGPGPLLVGRYVITAVVALAIGLIFALCIDSRQLVRPGLLPAFAPPPSVLDQDAARPKRSLRQKLHASLDLATDELFDMGRYLVAGSLLAAAMQTLVSQDALTALGSGPVISVLVMQLLAFVLSVCSTVDAFLALAFAPTFTTGAVLTFLTFGPMVDIKSTLMFTGVFRPKTVIYLVLLPLLMTAAIGIWLNLNVAF